MGRIANPLFVGSNPTLGFIGGLYPLSDMSKQAARIFERPVVFLD